MSDATKKLTPEQEAERKETYREWAGKVYEQKYETWVPWMEDQYLKWFGKDNKASYAAKDTLGKTKVTGIEQVDKIQDDVNNLVGGQVGKGGLLQPIGDLASKEGINRAERKGKDDKGSYGGPMAGMTDPAIKNAQKAGEGMTEGAKGAGNTVTEGAQNAGTVVTDGAKGAGSYLGGMFGGKK